MSTRRQFLALGGGLVVGGGTTLAALGVPKKKDEGGDEDVPPTEDLMREHGVLRRVLLVYDEIVRRIGAEEEVKLTWVTTGARIVREFIEDYHERDEEDFVFPALAKGPLAGLVDTLRQQHLAGRKLTDDILRLAAGDRKELQERLRTFAAMYRAHAAREDTVLFPFFRKLAGEKGLAKLQRTFEQREKALPGGGFEERVDQIAQLEIDVGIGDLAKLTPPV